VIRIDSVTAHPALEDLDVMMAVINHMPETALVTDHSPPLSLPIIASPLRGVWSDLQ
jgi:hypothetical protein